MGATAASSSPGTARPVASAGLRWTTTQHSASRPPPALRAPRKAVARASAWALGRAAPCKAGRMPVNGSRRGAPLSVRTE
eukprot:9417644-Alexandrium_andersonii.AAC.1